MFEYAKAFNGDLSKWDTKNVISMDVSFFFLKLRSLHHIILTVSYFFSRSNINQHAFNGADKFNGNLSNWDVSRVTSMENLFHYASSFDSDISQWDTSKIKSMVEMFSFASSFNHNISSWDVGLVTSMERMFFRALKFNQSLCSWNLGVRDDTFSKTFCPGEDEPISGYKCHFCQCCKIL